MAMLNMVEESRIRYRGIGLIIGKTESTGRHNVWTDASPFLHLYGDDPGEVLRKAKAAVDTYFRLKEEDANRAAAKGRK